MATVVLDPEGTLLDPAPCLRASIRYAVGVVSDLEPDLALPDTPGAFPPCMALAGILDASPQSNLVKDAMLHCADYYLANLARDARPYAGAREGLASLRSDGVAVVAMISANWQRQWLERHGLTVDTIVDGSEYRCPLSRAWLVDGLLTERGGPERGCWLTDCPPELAITPSGPALPAFAAWGRFGRRAPVPIRLECPSELERLARLVH